MIGQEVIAIESSGYVVHEDDHTCTDFLIATILKQPHLFLLFAGELLYICFPLLLHCCHRLCSSTEVVCPRHIGNVRGAING